MSIHAFKEALKPCKTTFPSSSSDASSSYSSRISHSFDSSIAPRKPPKSSLNRQLLRLQEDSEFYPQIGRRSSETERDSVPQNDGGCTARDGKEKVYGLKDSKLESFHQLGNTGPYEPLVLSLPGESPVVQVPASINSRLLGHQREGVTFLYYLFQNNHGGVLGDDMGLGKTIQIIAFLAAVFGKGSELHLSSDNEQIVKKGPVLIICPSSLILNWEAEISKWSTFNVSVYHGPNRDLIFDKLEADGVEILITSFDTYRIQGSMLLNIQWEIVVVDEVHRLKNEKSKLYTACLKIRTLRRYGLTGTVMQNNIMELFNLFDWAVPGSLGTREHFREFYDEPIKHGQRSSAPERFVKVANERKCHLISVLKQYMLRRTKEETIGHLMMGKEDNVVFCAMSELQKRVYKKILQLPDIQSLVNKDLPCSCGSPLKQVECCKRTVPDGLVWPYLHRDNPEGCDSCPFCLVLPCLVKLQQISNHLELIKPNAKDDQDKQQKDAEFASAVFGTDIDLVGGSIQSDSFIGVSDVRHCGKMRTLERLLHSWILAGDKILLFSYSVRMLDILEKFVIRKGYCFSRLDGSTPTSLRQSLVDDFNSSPSKQVFLISTRAGGLGLNLVSANRVVIFDPNWNPAQDLQAQDRSFRFGQKRHVTVFRLLAAGSLEELVYTRQIYKQQLSNIAVAGKLEKRYFEGVQDCKEFQGELFGICNLFRDLSDKLFTSEIVEFCEKEDGKEHDQCHRSGLDLTELGISFDRPQEEIAANCMEECQSTDPNDSSRKTRVDPVLEDLGVVYAHRNEDVVNMGRGGIQQQMGGKPRVPLREDSTTMQQPRSISTPVAPPPPPASSVGGMKDDDEKNLYKEEESSDSSPSKSKRQKPEQWKNSLLAVFMGMEEAELTKLLHSESESSHDKHKHDGDPVGCREDPNG